MKPSLGQKASFYQLAMRSNRPDDDYEMARGKVDGYRKAKERKNSKR
jgi:hypothetical protein